MGNKDLPSRNLALDRVTHLGSAGLSVVYTLNSIFRKQGVEKIKWVEHNLFKDLPDIS